MSKIITSKSELKNELEALAELIKADGGEAVFEVSEDNMTVTYMHDLEVIRPLLPRTEVLLYADADTISVNTTDMAA